MLTELIVVQGSEAYMVLQLHFASSGFIAPPRFQTDPNLGGTEKIAGGVATRWNDDQADISDRSRRVTVRPTELG